MAKVKYKCLSCGKLFEASEKLQCPYCGYRIAIKPAANVERRVKAR